MFGSDSDHHLKLVLDSTPDGITVQDPGGNLLYANLAAARLIGFHSPQELLETPLVDVMRRFELFDLEGNPFPLERLPGRQALLGEEPEEITIQFRRLNDGVTNWSVVTAQPVFDENGKLLFVVNTFHYVTDYMRALQAERESRERAEEAEQRITFLARCSEILGESLDYSVTLRRVSQLAVPDIADWCAVDLHFDRLERVSVAHVDAAKVQLAYEIQRRYPPREDAATGLYKVFRTGEPEIYPEITDEMLVQGAADEQQLRLLRQLDLHSMIIVPMRARERVLGAITFVTAESGRRFTNNDVALATELAQRAALAVENARLYAQAQRLNQQLERRVARRTAALRETNRRLKQKVEQIQEAERRFRALLESAPDAMIIVSPGGKIRLVNSQAEALFGYKRSEMLGESVETLIPGSRRAEHVEHRAQYAEQPRTRPMGAGLTLSARRKDGAEFPVEISLSPLQSEGETLFIAAVRDVSERRSAEERLRRSETQLAEAQAIANLGSWEWDITQDSFSLSKTMHRIFGLDPEETTPSYREFLNRVHQEDRPRIVEALRAARDRGIPFSLHHRVVQKNNADGSDRSVVRTMMAQGTVETDDDGNVLRIVGTSQDVTMQKEVEEELRRSEALYRAMADNLPNESVLVVDKDLRYRLARGPGLHVSDLSAWEGKTVEEVAGEGWRERATARYRRAFRGESTTEEVHRGGHVYFVQTVPLTDGEGKPYAGLTLVHDVTSQREAEETTRQLLELSRNLNATLDIGSLLETIEDSAVKLTKAHRGQLTMDRGRQTADDAEASVLHTPVVNLSGETLGYLEVTRKPEDAPFSDLDKEKLDGLAQIAAIALQNALSFEHLRELGQKLVSAQEKERRALSRELHDSTGQLLMALKMSISMLHEQAASTAPIEQGQLVEELEEIGDMVGSVYEEIRAVSHALRPPSLDVANLDEALSGLCEDYARHSGLEIVYTGCEPPDMPDNVTISLYRLLQEALTNVAKHAQAERVNVKLSNAEKQIELSVRDDGLGFGVQEVLQGKGRGGVGLVGLRERFELLGGALYIESSPGSGTRLAGMFNLENVN